MKIYTRRGDQGGTDLFGGARVSKDHLRVEAYGAVDELNSTLGVCAAETDQSDLVERLKEIQGTLFDLGAYLATPEARSRQKAKIPEPTAQGVERLEAWIDEFEKELDPLRRFILPGGSRAAAALHLARTVCRRAERRSVALHQTETLGDAALQYLNRLSDLLFVMARVENRRAGVSDVEWQSGAG